jgi:Family of unknown function (DUF5337)
MSAGMAPEPELRAARLARFVAVVIAATICLWLLAQWVGGALGLPIGYAFLFDIVAMAALIWSLIATWRIRRLRQGPPGGRD